MTNEVLTAVGLMSGTSMDGVDVALIRSDGEDELVTGAHSFRAYSMEERSCLRAALEEARALTARDARPPIIARAEKLVTDCHVQAVADFLRQQSLRAADISLIGFHGQTIVHRPELRLTVQIGDGEALSRKLGIAVVHDFRARDMAEGGQGAPIVPVFHQALARKAGLAYPTAILNIGGVANITWLASPDADPIACDTGPGGALLDDFMLERSGIAMDRDGSAAAAGQIDEKTLAHLLAHPYFALPPPKSLDRNAFDRAPVGGLSTQDGAATLTAFTAHGCASILRHFAAAPRSLVVAGGGASNPTLIAMLAQQFALEPVRAGDIGWSAEALEAQAFAYLAIRSLKGLPLTFPTTTGVRYPVSGGVLRRP